MSLEEIRYLVPFGIAFCSWIFYKLQIEATIDGVKSGQDKRLDELTSKVNDQSTVLLCCDWDNERGCRSLIRKNEIALGNINSFTFEEEFDLDTVNIPNSTYSHGYTEMANYQGYPLILGDWDSDVKLEMLVTTELPFQWNEQTDYPYSDG